MHKSHLPTILVFHILLAGLFLQGCGTHHDAKYSAKYLDSLVNINPRNVYTILDQEKDSTRTKEEVYRYALYSLLAKDKLYVTHKSDSLPSALINYYKSRDQHLLALSYYMLGASYADMGDVPEAVKAYLMALTKSTNHSQHLYTGLINSRLAYEYVKLGMYREAREHYLNSFQILSEVADTNRIIPTCLEIAETYARQNVDSMIYWQKKAYAIANQNKNNFRKVQSLLRITRSYLRYNNRAKANLYLSKIDSTSIPNRLQESYCMQRGEYYYNILTVNPNVKEELDSAKYYFTKLLRSKHLDFKSRAAYYISTLAQIKGDYKTAFNLQRERINYTDSLHSKKVFEATHKLEATYNYKLAQKAKEQAEEKARAYGYYLIFTCLLLITFLTITFLTIKWKQQRIETKTYKDFALGNLLEGVRKNFSLRERNSSGKTKTLQEDKQKNFIYNNEELANNYNLLQEMLEVEDRTIKDSEWQNIVQAVDSTLPKFRKHLDLLILKRSLSQQKYCYLTKLGFKQNEIAQLIPMSESGVSQLKRRLVKKIDSEEVSTQSLSETIQNL